MFAQQYQPQQFQPYLVPQMPPQPQQGGALIDELSKVIDLADKLRGRESAGNFAPGMARDATMGVGSMQTRSQEQLAQQEMLLSNPALLQQFQQMQAQQRTQAQANPGAATNGLQLNQQQTEQLKQSVNTLVQGSQQLYQYLQQSWQLLSHVMIAYNAMCNYAAELEKVAELGKQQNIVANAFLQERDAVYALADVQQAMLTDPVYLLHHAFNVWDTNLGTDKTALDYISQLYLELTARFDQRYEAATGQSPYPQQQQPQQSQNQQPTQQTPQGIDPNYFKAFSQAMSQGNPKVGQTLQKMHVQKFGI